MLLFLKIGLGLYGERLPLMVHRRFCEVGCASASKADPTPSAYQGLDFPYEFPVSVGSQSAPMRTLPCCLFS